MARLAVDGADNFIALAAIVRREQFPADYLEKILANLERSGLVISKKGVGGGYRLARGADKISVGQIFWPSKIRQLWSDALTAKTNFCARTAGGA